MHEWQVSTSVRAETMSRNSLGFSYTDTRTTLVKMKKYLMGKRINPNLQNKVVVIIHIHHTNDFQHFAIVSKTGGFWCAVFLRDASCMHRSVQHRATMQHRARNACTMVYGALEKWTLHARCTIAWCSVHAAYMHRYSAFCAPFKCAIWIPPTTWRYCTLRL